ncbi:MAG: DUF1800 domain-containing protein [Woeseiaceae bacterium]|nr:DUF1800 domain-containing protein [Woeseiaceae bacterium]
MKTETVIAANRFGLGARPGDLDKIGENAGHWLLDQLAGPSRQPDEFRGLPDSAAVFVEVQDIRRMQREMKQGAGDEQAPDIVRKYGRAVRRHYIEQTAARYRHAAATNLPFHERLVHFWSNHFAISADKQPIPAIAGLYENEAIRPNISGNFADLLIAVEQHPAMIVYLDNQRSIGPNSTLGRRANRRRSGQQFGLNENLAREILELHTLGVDGGYTQQDVTTFAKIITGWSIGGANENGRFASGEPGTFEFRDVIHEPGKHRVLGRSYAQSGVKQGEAVLRDLAVHPSTARFISTKLARHFIADEPTEATVGRLTSAYLESGGDLGALYGALVNEPAAWKTALAKYKSPHDFVVSTLRAFAHVPDDGRFVVGALDLMGQTPFRPGSPEGWPDTSEQWGGADALYKRVEWSNTVARVAGQRVDPVGIADAVLGPSLSPSTRKAVSRAESVVQGTTLLLASPDFQRR